MSIVLYVKTGQKNAIYLFSLFGFRVQVILRVRLWVKLLFKVKKENNNNDKKIPMGLRGIEEIIISPRQECQNTPDVKT